MQRRTNNEVVGVVHIHTTAGPLVSQKVQVMPATNVQGNGSQKSIDHGMKKVTQRISARPHFATGNVTNEDAGALWETEPFVPVSLIMCRFYTG